MNRQHFKEILEKLELEKPRTVEVLRMVLAGDTDAQIALSRRRTQGTVRNQISKIYRDFGIKGRFPSDRQSRRNELIALFQKYHPEWVHDCSSVVTNKASDGGEQVNPKSLPQPVSSSMKESKPGEDLMDLAITMLTQLGFNEMFKVSSSGQYIGYQLKNPDKGIKSYQLILAQQKKELSVSIIKGIVEQYALSLQYWEYFDLAGQIYLFTKAMVWILPSKKDAFLDSLHAYYWHPLKEEERTTGVFKFNKLGCDNTGYEGCVIDRIPLEEFNPETLSSRDTYLILSEDKIFTDTWQVCISSKEVLQEFIGHFGKILIENQQSMSK
ncbi:helix-turn-helix transcriptional regulator [Coleofasciculus sp. FACHB-T130]|uniref:helix-turn-helix domain-containing protein n=1 Tax=Cyanophyceae TaxID=3028117 RepID=UPI0016855077|nr:helix-turn-helix transcriptional regulator [Coleofasciculus sp. FACHB-T130]MBD1878863.1 helix-turn-helix transcriptional regulator [Coleofasciculus sp. FACHB-T130]